MEPPGILLAALATPAALTFISSARQRVETRALTIRKPTWTRRDLPGLVEGSYVLRKPPKSGLLKFKVQVNHGRPW